MYSGLRRWNATALVAKYRGGCWSPAQRKIPALVRVIVVQVIACGYGRWFFVVVNEGPPFPP